MPLLPSAEKTHNCIPFYYLNLCVQWKDPILSFDKVLDEAIDNGRDITKSDGKHE
jgi:hypothetical protein